MDIFTRNIALGETLNNADVHSFSVSLVDGNPSGILIRIFDDIGSDIDALEQLVHNVLRPAGLSVAAYAASVPHKNDNKIGGMVIGEYLDQTASS